MPRRCARMRALTPGMSYPAMDPILAPPRESATGIRSASERHPSPARTQYPPPVRRDRSKVTEGPLPAMCWMPSSMRPHRERHPGRGGALVGRMGPSARISQLAGGSVSGVGTGVGRTGPRASFVVAPAGARRPQCPAWMTFPCYYALAHTCRIARNPMTGDADLERHVGTSRTDAGEARRVAGAGAGAAGGAAPSAIRVTRGAFLSTWVVMGSGCVRYGAQVTEVTAQSRPRFSEAAPLAVTSSTTPRHGVDARRGPRGRTRRRRAPDSGAWRAGGPLTRSSGQTPRGLGADLTGAGGNVLHVGGKWRDRRSPHQIRRSCARDALDATSPPRCG